jgi:hypothetical protein
MGGKYIVVGGVTGGVTESDFEQLKKVKRKKVKRGVSSCFIISIESL